MPWWLQLRALLGAVVALGLVAVLLAVVLLAIVVVPALALWIGGPFGLLIGIVLFGALGLGLAVVLRRVLRWLTGAPSGG